MAAPPTLIDSPPPRSPQQAPRPGRKRHSALLPMLAFTLVALLGIGGFGAYWFLLRYEPTAHRHVPSGSSLAMRIDFQQIALFGPVRRHLWPLVFEKGATSTTDPGERALADRIEAATGLKLERDVREVVFVNYGATDSGRWLIVLGGKIPNGMVRSLAKLAAEEGAGWELSATGDALIWRILGVAIGQAKDRSLIIASDASALAAALPEQDGARAMGLPESGAVSFAVAASAWNEWGSGIAASLIPPLRTLAKLHGCNGRFALGSSPELEMQCRIAAGEDSTAIKSSLLGVVSALRGMSGLLGGPDQFGERQVLTNLRIETLEGGGIRLVAPWPLEGLERGAESLATKIRALRMLTGEPEPTKLRLPSLPELPSLPIPLPALPSAK